MTDVIIIGAGPAGLTAAVYALRASRSVLIFEQLSYGGQLLQTKKIENYTGYELIDGKLLAENFHNHAVKLGAEIVYERVLSTELTGEVKRITTAKGEYEARTVILASGVKRGKLSCKGEKELEGRGVSYCATCDGAFFRGKIVAVSGNNETAVEDALYLAAACDHVHIISKTAHLDAPEEMVEQLLSKENVTLHPMSVVEEIRGENVVKSISVVDLTEKKAFSLDVSGVFIAEGSQIEGDIFAGQLELDSRGYVIADESCKTNLPGVYVAGDARTKALRQIITAASDGACAAVAASAYLSAQKKKAQ